MKWYTKLWRWIRCASGFHHTGVVQSVYTMGVTKQATLERETIVCKDCGKVGYRYDMYTTYEENSDPVFKGHDDKWYFHGCDIVTNLKSMTYGPYDTEQIARTNLDAHSKLINGEACEDTDNS